MSAYRYGPLLGVCALFGTCASPATARVWATGVAGSLRRGDAGDRERAGLASCAACHGAGPEEGERETVSVSVSCMVEECQNSNASTYNFNDLGFIVFPGQ